NTFPWSTATVLIYTCFTHLALHSFPTRRSSDLAATSSGSPRRPIGGRPRRSRGLSGAPGRPRTVSMVPGTTQLTVMRRGARSSRSEEHTSELQSRFELVCRLLLEKKYNVMYVDV